MRTENIGEIQVALFGAHFRGIVKISNPKNKFMSSSSISPWKLEYFVLK
jgi:hypothetical protein